MFDDHLCLQEKETKAREQREAERVKKIHEIREAEKRSTGSAPADRAHFVR